ncbi:MAG TPA: cytochrome c biogenesis protein DipZ [Povalibacter sp.]|nr:cytochrome c biogenesis protein DipZ [Povalibacter sp.]
MILAVLSFLGGAFTIVSPCILPVLPFVFARSEQPFARSTLPLLLGMALTFAAVATLAAVGGGWAASINSYGRAFALILLAAFGLGLLSQRVAQWLARPFVALGNRLVESSQTAGATAVQSFMLGVATGFLWAPCAGPILGLILTGAALNGPSAQTTLLLLAYALGAIASLAVATLAGGKVFAALRRSLGTGEWIRRGLGVAVLVAVVAIALGWDTGVLTRLSLASTGRIEQSLLDRLPAQTMASGDQSMRMMSGTSEPPGSMSMSGGMMMAAKNSPGAPPIEGELPSLDGAVAWLNSPPLTSDSLRGKVVLIDFWTYSCINCLRALPYVKAWYERYKDQGFIVIGVHAPEFAFEKSEANVRQAVKQFGVQYPVALDNDYAIWRAFNNQYWPAHYFIDAEGRIRGHHFGEGNYDESEALIRTLLDEAGRHELPAGIADVRSAGIEGAADEHNIQSPETYVGYERAENFGSPGGLARDAPRQYQAPASLQTNQWALSGNWTVGGEQARLDAPGGRIVFRFHARDLHLVLGPGADGAPVRFRVTLDGKAPGSDHGTDIDEQGMGTVREQRLYQLIRQSDEVRERTFTIEFLDRGAQAYAFTFG